MNRARSLWIGVLPALVLAGALPAQSKEALDFELSDGRQFVRLSALPEKPTLVNFWRSDCPPCVREIPLLARIAQRGDLRVVMVAVQKPAETQALDASLRALLGPPLLSLIAPSQPMGLLARFGDRIGAIPHTVLLDPQRKACFSRTGEIDMQWLAQGIEHCR